MPLIFLKLGGSAITDKTRESTPRLDVIRDAARAINSARQTDPSLRLLLGHGSGSFGHFAARKWGFGVASGERTEEEHWRAYAETGAAAQRLNRLVTDIFLDEGVPVVSLQPSASARTRNGKLYALDTQNIRSALDHNLIPLIYGDVAFDDVRRMSIASTDALFAFLAPLLTPARIIYATAVNGIYTSDPIKYSDAQLIPEITLASFQEIRAHVGEAHGVDVTGGMLDKLQRSIALVEKMPQVEIFIIDSTEQAIRRALLEPNFAQGTRIRANSNKLNFRD